MDCPVRTGRSRPRPPGSSLRPVKDDEFRVEVDLGADDHGLSLGERLHALDLDDDARERLGGQATVTRDGRHLFVYMGSLEGASEAARIVGELADADELEAAITVTRWHP